MMWSAIFSAVTQFANMFLVLFGAGEKFAKAIDQIAEVTEQSATAFADEARMKREAQLRDLLAKAEQQKAKLAAPEALVGGRTSPQYGDAQATS